MPTNPIEYIWPGIIAAQAIYTATKLRIPDLLSSGPKTVAELAADCDAHPATLERLLRALTSIDMFALESDGRFRNTSLSEVLRAITLSRNVKVFSFCLRHFFGVRWEHYTIPFAAANLPSRESSGRNSSSISPIARKMRQPSIRS